MSQTLDRINASYGALEREADTFLREADPKGADRQFELVRTLRKALRRNRGAYAQIRAEVAAEVRAEMVEASLRRLGIPSTVRRAFDDLDPTDQAAMVARAKKLRQAGVTWPGDPPVHTEAEEP